MFQNKCQGKNLGPLWRNIRSWKWTSICSNAFSVIGTGSRPQLRPKMSETRTISKNNFINSKKTLSGWNCERTVANIQRRPKNNSCIPGQRRSFWRIFRPTLCVLRTLRKKMVMGLSMATPFARISCGQRSSHETRAGENPTRKSHGQQIPIILKITWQLR